MSSTSAAPGAAPFYSSHQCGCTWSRPDRPTTRAGSRRRALAAGAGLLLTVACTTEEIVMVTVASVEVVPEVVTAVEGDRVQLSATVRDESSERVSATGVVWRSDNPSIASVDGRGLVDARAAGSVRIRATVEGVSGATEIRVLRGPFVQVAQTSVGMFTAPVASPEPQVVAVTNGGAGDLAGLTVGVEHRSGQAGAWLGAALTGASAPAQLTLTARAEGLAAGMYDAEVRVSSSSSSTAAVIAVALSVAGFQVTETDGNTSVREGGGADPLSVVLRARPSTAVLLNVHSSDPTEVTVSPASLRFTPSNWSAPQSVTVRAVDDTEDDGDQSVSVIVSVDVGQSHDAFDGLPDRTVTVVSTDNDEPAAPGIIIEETGPDTRVSESGMYDSVMVRLATRPASDVVLSVSSSNDVEVAITSPSLLTFTPSNWSIPQIVVVRGIDDFFDDGDRDVTITFSVVNFLSADAYGDWSASVTVRSIDNDDGGGGGGGGTADDDDADDDDDDDDRRGRGRGGGGG